MSKNLTDIKSKLWKLEKIMYTCSIIVWFLKNIFRSFTQNLVTYKQMIHKESTNLDVCIFIFNTIQF